MRPDEARGYVLLAAILAFAAFLSVIGMVRVPAVVRDLPTAGRPFTAQALPDLVQATIVEAPPITAPVTVEVRAPAASSRAPVRLTVRAPAPAPGVAVHTPPPPAGNPTATPPNQPVVTSPAPPPVVTQVSPPPAPCPRGEAGRGSEHDSALRLDRCRPAPIVGDATPSLRWAAPLPPALREPSE